MIPEKRILLEKWLLIADHDLEVARYIIEGNPLVLDAACFHCQQAIEKYLKAFLTYKEFTFPKTHDIELLNEECNQLDSDFGSLDFKELNQYAVRARYPDGYVMPSMQEAKEYHHIVLLVKELVTKKIIFP
jgi:HEPN domain-containing protein